MANKKLITSVVAIATAAVLATGGTFAWQSINQRAVNEASDVINPGGRLHNDLGFVDAKTTNSDIYVENFADSDIFARVRVEEYMEVVMNYGTAAEKVEAVAGSKTLKDGQTVGEGHNGATEKDKYDYTYATHVFGLTDEEKAAGTENNKAYSFFDWKDGKDVTDKYFMPTFNKNKDSLLADLNGTYADSLGGISNRSAEQYVGENEVTEISTETKFAIYDADENRADELADLTAEQRNDIFARGETSDYFNGDSIRTVEETHTAATVGTTKGLISMADWIALGETYAEETHGNYWVYDTDGWVYWSSPIKAGAATGLLIDSFTLKQVMDDSWYYAINVVGQFVTANDSGKGKGTGFYDTVNGTVPSENAEKLLEMIGIENNTVVRTAELKNGYEMLNEKTVPFIEISNTDSVKVKSSSASSIDEIVLGWYIDGSMTALTKDTDYTFEDGIFKLTSAGKEICSAGTVGLLGREVEEEDDPLKEQELVLLGIKDNESTLTLKTNGTNYIVANVGDEIPVAVEGVDSVDGSKLTAASFLKSNFDKSGSEPGFTYSDGKITFESSNYKQDLVVVTYKDGETKYEANVILKSDDVTTDPVAPEHTLSVAAASYDKTGSEDGKTFYLYDRTGEPELENAKISLNISYDGENILSTDNLTIYAYDVYGEASGSLVQSTAFKGAGNVEATVYDQGNNKVFRLKIVAEYNDNGTFIESDPIYVSFYNDEIVLGEESMYNRSSFSEYLNIKHEYLDDILAGYNVAYSFSYGITFKYGEDEETINLTKDEAKSNETYEIFSAEINGVTVDEFFKVDYNTNTISMKPSVKGRYSVKTYHNGVPVECIINIS